jgi:CheY-like chemotaxis protein
MKNDLLEGRLNQQQKGHHMININILLLAVNDKIRAYVERQLSEITGYSVTSARSIQAAWEELDAGKQDVLLLELRHDLDMEEVIEFLRNIRSVDTLKDLPVIFMHEHYETFQNLLERRVIDQKMTRIIIPFFLATLVEKIDDLLKTNQEQAE